MAAFRAIAPIVCIGCLPATDSAADQGDALAEKSPQQTIQELKDLVVAYFKQETLDPLKGLGRYLLFGLLAALLLGTGVFFLAMSGLRALQTETGTTFTGNWSWAPYGIVVAVLLALAGIAWTARSRRNAKSSSGSNVR
jgi:hypothetical protein